MGNPICKTMGWEEPLTGETLILSLGGRDVARLSPSDDSRFTLEGIYLINNSGWSYGPCYSVVGVTPAASIKAAMAQKLKIKPERLAEIKTTIHASKR